ncbi:hypothetical protein DRW42_10410 [Pedobacter miscanthi]|uniref:Uncharacterized protein n=1 Tax=Pedobacter miscanthi TaxID=2259170 RepID=A0A366L371_9SPHI|nr:hypothetical protein DRW42_10410 [Pedobacter miscanthi]
MPLFIYFNMKQKTDVCNYPFAFYQGCFVVSFISQNHPQSHVRIPQKCPFNWLYPLKPKNPV